MATPGDTVPLSGNPAIEGLVQGKRWDFAGGAHELSYSFSVETELGIGWTAGLKDAVRRAFDAWAAVADLGFHEIADGSDIDTSPADLALAPTGNLLALIFFPLQLTAFGLFPDPVFANSFLASLPGNTRDNYPHPEGDIYFDNATAPYDFLAPGGVGAAVFLHEIGHALGLKHPFDSGQNGRPAGIDDPRITVMSFGGGTSTPSSGYPVTPLLDDIRAIQHIYGANNSYHTGDDTYLLRADGARRAIWDAGGIDTLDATAAPAGLVIRLAEGSLIDILAKSTVAIAYGVTIENAIGSAFADRITGNAADNRLEGRGGADTLEGGAGADTLAGGAGDDSYLVDDAADLLIEDPGAGTDLVTSSAASYTLGANLERLSLAGAAIAGTGNELANQITGNAGDNRLEGGAGDDTLNGGLGSDTLIGGAGDDTYVYGAGNVVVEFDGQGTDTLLTPVSAVLPFALENLFLTGLANVNATGNAAENLLRGNAGNNVLDGGAGRDTLEGGAGDDTYVLDDLQEQGLVSDGAGVDTVVSGLSYTLLMDGLEKLVLTGDAWIGQGNEGANLITGNARANALLGDGGSDTLAGGGGADALVGGAGADRFVFDSAPGAGNVDRILDFSAAQGDRIVLDRHIFAALGAPGALSAAEFRAAAWANAGADASDRIVLDTASGALYYDADGDGAQAAVLIAVITGTAGITAANFEIIA